MRPVSVLKWTRGPLADITILFHFFNTECFKGTADEVNEVLMNEFGPGMPPYVSNLDRLRLGLPFLPSLRLRVPA